MSETPNQAYPAFSSQPAFDGAFDGVAERAVDGGCALATPETAQMRERMRGQRQGRFHRLLRLIRTDRRFPELSYACSHDSALRQWFIRWVEKLSGRDHFADLYEIWRNDIVGKSATQMGDMLKLINVGFNVKGEWPMRQLPDEPLVLVANHPFGIGDGVALLSLAEQLGRPWRVIINNELLKVPEIRPWSLPISFAETREALAMNLSTRQEAVRLLKEGVTVVVFPAGGVATARLGIGAAVDLPWKLFPAKMIQQAGAAVIPIHFEGQNGRLFHFVSSISSALRTSLFIREFRKLVGRTITATVRPVIPANHLAQLRDRQQLTDYLHASVFQTGRLPNPVSFSDHPQTTNL